MTNIKNLSAQSKNWLALEVLIAKENLMAKFLLFHIYSILHHEISWLHQEISMKIRLTLCFYNFSTITLYQKAIVLIMIFHFS